MIHLLRKEQLTNSARHKKETSTNEQLHNGALLSEGMKVVNKIFLGFGVGKEERYAVHFSLVIGPLFYGFHSLFIVIVTTPMPASSLIIVPAGASSSVTVC